MTVTPDRCAEVQELVSTAFDGEPVDAESFASAKAHCTECPECASFVTFLADVRRLPAPEVPDEVLGRVLDAVRLEASRSPESPSLATPAPEAKVHPPSAVSAPPRERWRTWAPWAAAAAVFFVAAGMVTAQGVRYLLTPTGPSLTSDVTLEVAGDDRARHPVPLDDGLSEDEADTSALSAEEYSFGQGTVEGPAYVTFAGRVYRLDSVVDAAPPTATERITSSLDSGGIAVTRQTFRESGSDAIIVENDDGSYLRFVPVTRTLRGRIFELSSPPITAFGIWPSLPPNVPQPTSPDGVPDLVPAGTDDAGVAVFALPGEDVSAGFAIAPGTSPGDPAEGNPGWTWWVPATP